MKYDMRLKVKGNNRSKSRKECAKHKNEGQEGVGAKRVLDLEKVAEEGQKK
jgi:hypothetical protein